MGFARLGVDHPRHDSSVDGGPSASTGERQVTRDDIVRMAQKAGLGQITVEVWSDYLVNFSALIAAEEREACAALCEEEGLLWGSRYAKKIRSKGKE